MGTDEYQEAWKAHSENNQVKIDVDVIMNAVLRNQKEMQSAIYWSDISDMGISLVLLPIFFYLGTTMDLHWAWYLMMSELIWDICFKLVVRFSRRKRGYESCKPLLNSSKESLNLVEEEIFLKRNILFSSLLPKALVMIAFFSHSA